MRVAKYFVRTGRSRMIVTGVFEVLDNANWTRLTANVAHMEIG